MSRPSIGRPSTSSGLGRRAFTLLEILLALAVIALMSTVLIGTSASLLRDRTGTPDDVFWKACQEARKSAVKTGNQMQLTFDSKAKAFVIDDGTRSQSFAVPGPAQDVAVNFLSTQGDRSAVLIGGEAVETGPAPSVFFFPDGTCTPFRVQFLVSGVAHILAIDPWTCAKVLTPKQP